VLFGKDSIEIGVEFGGKAVAFVIEFCIGRAIIINQKRMME